MTEHLLHLEDVSLDLLAVDPSTAADPLYDAARLSEVAMLAADDVEHVQALVDDLVATAAEAVGTPIGLVNVVLTSTQVIAGAHGLTGWIAEARATPAEWSLCATVVRRGAPYVVPDLMLDPDTADNPLCTVDGLRSYAGVPLRTSSGSVLGALCVLDGRSRAYGDRELALLEALAAEAVRRLEEAAA